MEYIIIGLLVVILIISVISLMKNVNESNITERLGKLETNTIKELGDLFCQSFISPRQGAQSLCRIKKL